MINGNTLYNCFGSNFIGIAPNCGEADEPATGFYLSDEIQLSNIAKIATDEDGTGKRLFDRMQRNAILQVAGDLAKELTNQKIQLLSGRKTTCFNLSNNRILKIRCTDELGGLFLEKIKTNESTTLFFTDEYGNTQTLTPVNGIVHLNFSGLGEYGYIYTNDAEVSTIEEIEHKCRIDCGTISCGCVDISTFENDELTGDGLTDNVIYVSCECSFDYMICAFKKYLAYPVYYNLIGRVYKERWQSGNLDNYIQGSREFSEEMFRTYLHGFEDKTSMYEEALKSAVQIIKSGITNKRTKCVKCTGTKIVSLV